MSLQVTVDIVADSGLSRRYEGLTLVESATRVAQVTGLTTGAATDAATALSRALNAVAALYPRGTLYPGGIRAVVQGWAPAGIPQSDDAANIKIIYDTIQLPFTQGTIVVSDTTSTENDTSQFFRDDTTTPPTIQQLSVNYDAPRAPVPAANIGPALFNAAAQAAPTIHKQFTATIGYEKTMRRVVLQTSFLKGNLAKFRAAVNCTNKDAWNGLPPFFWRLDPFITSTRDLGQTYEVTIGAVADIQKNVSKFAILRDTSTGKLVQVDPLVLAAATAAKYAYGIIWPPNGFQGNSGGLLRVGQYRPISFTALFGAIVP